jgi:peptidoglycan/xylan/chitin deacetylase (PgdA/CDA1 family)
MRRPILSSTTLRSGAATVHALAVDGTGSMPLVPWRLSAEDGLLENVGHDLPPGAARAEAVAARLQRSGQAIVWGEPVRFACVRALLSAHYDRGASSIDVVRADPELLPHLQIGAFFAASRRVRAARRILLTRRTWALAHLARGARGLRLAIDVAFWSGVRAAATQAEWDWLTRCSYVVLYYHRVAGEDKPGQERLDVAPAAFERQMRWLRRLRLRPLTAAELVSFHNGTGRRLPRRAFVLAADDGFRDAAVALARHLDLRPFLFVTTSAIGGSATWAGGEQIVSWPELIELARRGAEIGSHSHTHVALTDLDDDVLAFELTRSLEEVRSRFTGVPMVAYPHGRNDERVRHAAAAAGYELGFTTATGRNSVGTDRYALRRVGLKDWDGAAAVAWKALTGELVPPRVERLRLRLHELRQARRRAARRP